MININELSAMMTVSDSYIKVNDVKKSFLKMFGVSIFIVVLAWSLSKVLNSLYPLHESASLYFSVAGYICWGTTLGALGSKLMTWNHESPAEILDQKLNYLFSLLGVFFFTMSSFIE